MFRYLAIQGDLRLSRAPRVGFPFLFLARQGEQCDHWKGPTGRSRWAILLLYYAVPMRAECFRGRSSCFCVSFLANFCNCHVFLLLSNGRCNRVFRVSRGTLFSRRLPLPSFNISIRGIFPTLLFRAWVSVPQLLHQLFSYYLSH